MAKTDDLGSRAARAQSARRRLPDAPRNLPVDAPARPAQTHCPHMATPENRRAHWRANLRILVILIALWALVSFGAAIFFADALDRIRIGGFKLGFWMGHQGAILVFVGIIAFYVWFMNRLDRRHDVHER
jgi:putative solute:sodium symporter small subunit